MIRSILVGIIVSLFLVTPAFSANIGPVKSSIAGGDFTLGLGYSRVESKFDDSAAFPALELQQDLVYVQAGLGLSSGWMTYVRGGISSQSADGAFIFNGVHFEGENAVPFATLGVNGVFFKNDVISIGPFAQGTYYFGENTDSVTVVNIVETRQETVTLDNMWEGRAGVQLQVEVEGVQLYGGAIYYLSSVDIKDEYVNLTTSSLIDDPANTMEEEGAVGYVVGAQWQLLDDVTLDLEAQLRSSYEVGLLLNKRF